MSLFSFFTIVVLAAETIISPLADSASTPIVQQPTTSFGNLASIPPDTTQSSFASVLGETTEQIATPTLTPTPTRIQYHTRKKQFTIALLGDSMTDTLGPNAPHLKNKLTTLYPGISFSILNYGVGATNIDYGLERVTNSYTYLGKSFPALVSQSPDIVVVESFGYNPYTYESGALDQHWIQLAKIVNILKTNIPGVKIVIAATIAPNSKAFGDGAPSIAFSQEDKLKRTQIIKQYLESTVKFAKNEHIPLADAYHAGLDNSGDGLLTYINGVDHIHYSDPGRALFAQKVTDAILKNKLLE
jgi:lysophospholipase L1-like esterase